jgi:hypothetical protein
MNRIEGARLFVEQAFEEDPNVSLKASLIVVAFAVLIA